MCRPEPFVLFAQTFVHQHLDEYVDEIVFAEPVVITACEFVEQGSSSVSPSITMPGTTSPPSFAMELFVQCEGETKFRRLCQPFLYSHSSSNILEVEVVVTDHLVVRGSYRSLSLVIYGNTAEDLGQFNVEFDLDNSINNVSTSAEVSLDELPLVMRKGNVSLEDYLSPPSALSLSLFVSSLSGELKQLVQIVFRILVLSDVGDDNIISKVLSAASSCVSCDLQCPKHRNCYVDVEKSSQDPSCAIANAMEEILAAYKILYDAYHDASREVISGSVFLDLEIRESNSLDLVVMFNQYINVSRTCSGDEHYNLQKGKIYALALSLALFLCMDKESCFHFINGGGMEQISSIFSDNCQNHAAITLMLLGVVEHATRHAIGCEGFLGWWPRKDETVPSGYSEGYCHLLKLLLCEQRHDIASLATYILHRLRFYEIASRYEYTLLSMLKASSSGLGTTHAVRNMLTDVRMQLRKLLKLIDSHGLVEDPSQVARAGKLFMLGQTEGLLSYNTTHRLIALSRCSYSTSDIDPHLLSLLKERGFLPLSVAFLASSVLHSRAYIDLCANVMSSLWAMILELLFSRSGLTFFLLQPELSTTLFFALVGANSLNEEESIPARYALTLISKGFFCHKKEFGMIFHLHLRAANAIDRLLILNPHSEEFLWVLWELSVLTRFECGRQALLSIQHFPEAILLLIDALRSTKELDPVAANNGTSPLSLAIFHSSAEILEAIVSDSTSLSLTCWIKHAMELHGALHYSSPGSSRKDAPTRLLEWIDAAVVYHKNGALGLLRYAAVLASGGDAHLTSTSILVSDFMDAESVGGETSGGSDINVLDNLGKLISEKSFDGVTLRDSSISQLTTAFRILAFISENQAVAAALYDEGTMAVVYAVLVNCRFMLERSSSSYDYLVDEGTECNSTYDLLLGRNREHSLISLLVPCLLLMNNLLQKLQECEEQHRNTRLLNALLRLHCEVSTRLAAWETDMSSSYPDGAILLGTICHIIASALACWPIFGWGPGLFCHLVANLQTTSLLSLGPKEACSLFIILNDLLPDEGICFWRNGMPFLTVLRTVAVSSLLGPHAEKHLNWYLEPKKVEVILSQLMPHLENFAQIILHYAITSLVVIQDMLRIFVTRFACKKAKDASILLRPLISSIQSSSSDFFSQLEVDAYKAFRMLDFVASLLEHPCVKDIFLKEGIVKILVNILEKFEYATSFADGSSAPKSTFGSQSLLIPIFRTISLLCGCQSSKYAMNPEKHSLGCLNPEDCSLIFHSLLSMCQVLPVQNELVSCLVAFEDLGSCTFCRNSLSSNFFLNTPKNEGEEVIGDCVVGRHFLNEDGWKKSPPFFSCWTKLLKTAESNDDSMPYAVDAIGALCIGSLRFCMDGKSLNSSRVSAIKYLFGCPCEINGHNDFPEENFNHIKHMSNLLSSRISCKEKSVLTNLRMPICKVLKALSALLLLLQNPTGTVNLDAFVDADISLASSRVLDFKACQTTASYTGANEDNSFLEETGRKFMWECPEISPDRYSQGAVKRKLPPLDGGAKRVRGDSPAEGTAQSVSSRPLGIAATSGPTRRDVFRQRKPNTSRPPSMHVDEYVARERNIDGTAAAANVIPVQRVGSIGGRPPSIHVDEFIARQKERDNAMAGKVAEVPPLLKSSPMYNAETEMPNKAKQLKTGLDDDLQEIDIVFDSASPESDDKLPFFQLDDNLQQPSVIAENHSPHSEVEETEYDVGSTSNMDDSSRSEYFTKPSSAVTRAGETSVSSGRKLFEHTDESKNVATSKIFSSFESSQLANVSSFPSSAYPSMLGPSQGVVFPHHPPLPPTPRPSTLSPVISHPFEVAPSQASPYPSDSKVMRTILSSVPAMGSRQSAPSIPSIPPGFSSLPLTAHPQSGAGTEFPQISVPSLSVPESGHPAGPSTKIASYPQSLQLPLHYVLNRPFSASIGPSLNKSIHQPGENMTGILQNLNAPPPPILPLQPPALLQPLQPPQISFNSPPLPPQHAEQQVSSGAQALNVQVQQMLQQSQISPHPLLYQVQHAETPVQTQQKFSTEPSHMQASPQEVNKILRTNSAMSLKDYFSSPEAIQSLLGDREKLCQLLEQHPKLMLMLQEKLGQF